MTNAFELAERPDRAQLEAAKTEIIAFREQHRTLSTAALAIAFIEKRGTATSAELSLLLDLGASQYPSVVLSSSTQNGRLACVGRVWTLGPKAIPGTREQDKSVDVVTGSPELAQRMNEPVQAVAAVVAAQKDALESGAELGKREPKPLDVPVFAAKHPPLPQPKPAPTPAVEPAPAAKPSRCRFAVWSDGKVEIQFPSLPSVVLTREEFDDLVRFVSRERA